MKTSRLEAFSDGVLAILITILVLGLEVPQSSTVDGLRRLFPEVATYAMSFVYLGIYWNNHHHLMHATEQISGWVLWANLHLMFWLSLVPLATAWLERSGFAPLPTAVYGGVLLLAGLAWSLLQWTLLAGGKNSRLRAALGSDWKAKASLVLYAAGLAAAFVAPWGAIAIYNAVALMWLVPDRRFEQAGN